MRGTLLTIDYFNNRSVKVFICESEYTDLTFSSNWGIEYQRWETIVNLGCFIEAGT